MLGNLQRPPCQALAHVLSNAGYSVRTTGNDPFRMKGLVILGNVIILAVPFSALDEVAATIGTAVDGKPVVDATNVLSPEFTLASGYTTSAAEELQKKLPSAHMVKAFNPVLAGTLNQRQVKGERLTTAVAGDDAQANATVQELARHPI